jgi:hypothetical protein
MVAYLRRHHIGLLALFIALGGTSYAAAKLPRNSVGTAQIKSGAVNESKLAQGVRDKLGRTVQGSPGGVGAQGPSGPKGDTGATGPAGKNGATGPAGEPGATGPAGPPGADGEPGATGKQGDTGPQGPKGDAGAAGKDGATGPQGIPGPVSGGIGGTNINITPAAGTAIPASTSVTLTQPGKVLVFIMGTFSVRCTSAGDCDREIGASVGGTQVPGAFATISGETGVNTEQTINSAGILTNVPAGTHTVSLTSRVVGPSNGSGAKGDPRIVAIALG